MYDSVVIKQSTRAGKKKMAVFTDSSNGRKKTTHFGAAGMSDYTIHKDRERMNRYLNRHRKRENWDDYTSAGSLSRWILWNKTSYSASVADYKRRFGLKTTRGTRASTKRKPTKRKPTKRKTTKRKTTKRK
jgi:hypothetical protein